MSVCSTMLVDPTGVAVSMYCWTTAFRMADLRSSSMRARVPVGGSGFPGTPRNRIGTQSTRVPTRTPCTVSVVQAEGGDERIRRHLDATDVLHAALAALLLLEQLLL